VGGSVLLYLALGGFARVSCDLDRLDFRVNIIFDLDFVALLDVLDVQEHVVDTRVLVSDGAECLTALARTYGVRCSRLPVSYCS
jgi:hypothetical protein